VLDGEVAAVVASGMTLKRDLDTMPDAIAAALDAADLRAAYDERPPYQRNDYIGWITGAARPATRHKRLAQMLEELRHGDVYMNMPWRGGRR